MPSAIPKPCAAPGCPRLVRGKRYCEAHQKDHWQRQDSRRGTPAERGYDQAWRRVRDAKLAADSFCEECGRAVATEVHHIRTIAERPDLRLERSNLKALCKACHSAITMRECVHG